MKLRDLEVFVTAPPAPGWGGRYWILVKVSTGLGDAMKGLEIASLETKLAERGW